MVIEKKWRHKEQKKTKQRRNQTENCFLTPIKEEIRQRTVFFNTNQPLWIHPDEEETTKKKKLSAVFNGTVACSHKLLQTRKLSSAFNNSTHPHRLDKEVTIHDTQTTGTHHTPLCYGIVHHTRLLYRAAQTPGDPPLLTPLKSRTVTKARAMEVDLEDSNHSPFPSAATLLQHTQLKPQSQ